VTTVSDVPVAEHRLRDLAATVKQRCGTGGTVKDGRIEIQGDQRERIVAELETLGYKVKRAGIPDDVAALVEAMDDTTATVVLVNVNQVEPRTVVVQAGAYAEHQFLAVSRSLDRLLPGMEQ
jgi:hypothetical protein